MRVMICDKCGKEVREFDLYRCEFVPLSKFEDSTAYDICKECISKIGDYIEGDREE